MFFQVRVGEILTLVVVGFVLFIIPGIYVSLLFSQVFYIVSENNDVNIKDAFKEWMKIKWWIL